MASLDKKYSRRHSDLELQAGSAMAGLDDTHSSDVESAIGSPVPDTSDACLEFNVVNFSSPQGKQILHNINGVTYSGQFTALMGPSGAGKTTLMDCVALRQRKFKGAIHLDGISPKGDFFTQTGYVHQKELFFSNLTPREHLTFHAINRLSGSRSRDSCIKRVEEVIKEVELVKCADTVIGGGEFYVIKGLSGGERKRLAIGTELLSHPKILFLDEPTSGLDSVMGDLVCELLNGLASGKKGGMKRIIFCVIHTPSSKMWSSFTHVLLLGRGGRLAYHGERAKLLPYFETLGYNVPKNYNPADYALEVVSAVKRDDGTGLIDGYDFTHVVEHFAKDRVGFKPLKEETDHLKFRSVKGASASFFTQFRMNVWRALTQQNRDKSMTYALIGMLVLLGLIFGLLFLGQAHESWRNLMGMIFALITAILILCSMHVALSFPIEWSIFMREYYTGANSLESYFLGRTIADIPHLALFLIMVIIPYWMSGMTAAFVPFFNYCLVMFLIINASASTGYFASSFSPDPQLGLALTPIVDTPMILFSGMLYERGRVPFFLKWMQYLSLVNYGFAGIMINECKEIGYGPTTFLILEFIQVSLKEYTQSVLCLLALVIGYRVGAYLVLKWRVRNATSL